MGPAEHLPRGRRPQPRRSCGRRSRSARYRNYINVYAVEIASIDYGVRCDPDGRVRAADGTIRDTGVREGPINAKNTALRMIFDGGCTDPLARGTVYAAGAAGCNCAADSRSTTRPA